MKYHKRPAPNSSSEPAARRVAQPHVAQPPSAGDRSPEATARPPEPITTQPGAVVPLTAPQPESGTRLVPPSAGAQSAARHVAQPPPAGARSPEASARSPEPITTQPRAAVPPKAPQPRAAVLHTPITLRIVEPHERPLAKPVKASYRRNLPHLQIESKPLFVTIATHERWVLPDCVRDKVLQHCLHDHGVKLYVFGTIVMPDHVHLVFEALHDPKGNVYGLAEIMSGIKGASAHSVNKLLGRGGQVWQGESYDHVCRCNELPHDEAEYICYNPVRKGLVLHPDAYRWLWREWIEGQHG